MDTQITWSRKPSLIPQELNADCKLLFPLFFYSTLVLIWTSICQEYEFAKTRSLHRAECTVPTDRVTPQHRTCEKCNGNSELIAASVYFWDVNHRDPKCLLIESLLWIRRLSESLNLKASTSLWNHSERNLSLISNENFYLICNVNVLYSPITTFRTAGH
jgi:hypothetical protein